MRMYADTDIEISNLVSCCVCGNWYWSKLMTEFICCDCKELYKEQRRDYQRRKNGESYKRSPESIERSNNIFSILVEYKDTGLKIEDLKRVSIRRGYITKSVYDVQVLLERSGCLTWTDKFGRLRPYKNLNTGERYDETRG